MLDRFISGVVRAADPSDRQAIEVRDRSLLIARETLTNSMDFAQQVMHVRQPQELFQLQSEFVSKTSADRTDEEDADPHTDARTQTRTYFCFFAKQHLEAEFRAS